MTRHCAAAVLSIKIRDISGVGVMTFRNTFLGVDLSSYQTKTTALVRLTMNDGDAEFKILSRHPFNAFNPQKDTIATQIEREILFLNYCYKKIGDRIVVDAPIDLSQMPLGTLTNDYSLVALSDDKKQFRLVEQFDEPWRLRMRPIDQALRGLAPVFSLLGLVTQRARLALAKAQASETYPKISKVLVGYERDPVDDHLSGFKKFLQRHGVSLHSSTDTITHDEFDAIWCALAGLAISDVATEHSHAMENEIYANITSEYYDVPWPKNYRLLSTWPKCIHSISITREPMPC